MRKKTDSLFANYKSKIDIYIGSQIKSFEKTAFHNNNPLSNHYVTALGNTIRLGGKRIRPAIMYYSYLLAGGKPSEEIVKLSIFLEVLQSYLLIHDDIIDRADTRRKEKTTHIVYQEYAHKHNIRDPKWYGEMVALLIGDIAGNYINKIIIKNFWIIS